MPALLWDKTYYDFGLSHKIRKEDIQFLPEPEQAALSVRVLLLELLRRMSSAYRLKQYKKCAYRLLLTNIS